MKKLCFMLSLFTAVVMLLPVAVSAKEYKSEKVYISDSFNHLTETELDEVAEKAESFAEKTGYNVGVVITDDIGSKSEVAYSDDSYEKVFGKNVDGVMILINNDTYVDHISTARNAIIMFDDRRIASILAYAHGNLKDENFAAAIDDILYKMNEFYDEGEPESNSDYYYNDITDEIERKFPIGTFLMIFVPVFLVSSVVIFFCIKMSYRFKKAEAARVYMNSSATFFREKSDTFIREYTTSHRISSDSSGGGGGGFSGSSTHHSSGGGTFGGGSAHR